MAERSAAIWRTLYATYLFIQLTSFAFTSILPLLGAASAGATPTAAQLLGLIGAALAFHIFAYVFNDVIDLPLDRTQPLRAEFPLVRGAVQPSQALAIALAQIPIAFALTAWLGAPPEAYVALGVAFTFMAIYDLWGKRTPFPPFTDLVQSLGWGALLVYGALVAQGRPALSTSVAVAFVVVYVMLISGVHGGLRDMANDFRGGARTTAILLGARPQGEQAVTISRTLVIYGIVLQATTSIVLLAPLAANWFAYSPLGWAITLGVVSALVALSWFLFRKCFQLLADRWEMIFVGTWHTSIMLLAVVVLFVPAMTQPLLIATLAVFAGSLLTSGWLYEATAKWLRRWTARGVSRLSQHPHEPL